jgi:hypothetical protein
MTSEIPVFAYYKALVKPVKVCLFRPETSDFSAWRSSSLSQWQEFKWNVHHVGLYDGIARNAFTGAYLETSLFVWKSYYQYLPLALRFICDHSSELGYVLIGQCVRFLICGVMWMVELD